MALKYSGPLFGKIGRKHIPLKAHSDDVDKMECDIASLRSALAEKTAQVERLREFAEHIDQWSNAYPEGMFPDPAPEQIDQVCKTLGCRIDSIAAMILRETVKPFGDLAREALAATASNPCPSCAESVDGKPGNGACMQCLEERSNE